MASILLISPDRELAQALLEGSKGHGWSVTALDSVPVEGLDGAGPGVVIVDVRAERARAWLSDDERAYHPLTIVVADESSLEDVHRWSVDDFVVQPVRASELLTRTRLLIERSHTEPSPVDGARMVRFFESLINASGDAFVVSDMHGKIQLFNKGAERLCGQRAEDVVGKLHLREIFTAAGADAVMTRVLAKALREETRLEPMVIDAVAVNGDMIPIRLSAAIARDGDTPTGIVLVFEDVREQLLAERKLEEAQKKLGFSQKQSVLAELAGTAAHKLNQPLTSVMAYAELLKQKSEPGSVGENVAGVLLQEADRMADIVRKLGSIARYETTSYVGTQKIFDLDRAAEANDPSEVEKGS